MEEMMRINKFLSKIGVASRREVDRLIDSKEIMVNGELATSGMKVSEKDKIEISGKQVNGQIEEKVYYILNKPKATISAVKDDRGRTTVVDLIDDKKRIYPIGRLDLDTTGVLLLTNDGDLFNKVIHPRSTVYKTYYAVVKGEVTDEEIKQLREGIELEDGITLPARVALIRRSEKSSKVLIEIREGRNRQVRRMFRALDHPVYELTREKIGKLGIEGLAEGEYRKLTKQEIEYLYKL